jgi:integrase
MPPIKLTDAAVQRLKAPPGGRVDYFDATLPGFALRVAGATPRAPEGRRSWVLFYRHGGKQHRLTFDPPYPALGLADARRKAGDALAMLAEGKNPAADKAAAKAAASQRPTTLRGVVDEYLHRGLEKKERAPLYVTETRRGFDNHVLPRFGETELRAIRRGDIITMLDEIAETGTTRRADGGKKHAVGGPIAANRVLAAVRALFNWAIRRGLIDTNPCALVERPGRETPRERVLDPDEICELWPQFEAQGYPFGRFFQLTLVTGQRRSEVGDMRWDGVEIDAKTWTLGGDETKAKRGHVIPLSDLAVRILKTLPSKTTTLKNGSTAPSPWVFTTDGSSPISGFSKAKRIVEDRIAEKRKQAGRDPIEPWGIHDLRRTAATEMGRLGVSEFIIARVLNHAARGVTGKVYNRYEYLEEKRRALDLWGQYLDNLTTPHATNIVPLRQAAVQ